MSMYSDLENRLVGMLRGAAGLEGVKTIEASIRECLLSADKQTKGFRPGELPAIGVTAQLKASKSRPFSVGEKQYEIPLTIAVVTRAQQRPEALSRLLELMPAIEKVLDAARKSGNPLGENVVVAGDITSDAAAVPDGPQSYGIGTVEFTVLKVVEL